MILDECTENADCNGSDDKKECVNKECVCKSGHYSDRDGKCVAGKTMMMYFTNLTLTRRFFGIFCMVLLSILV